MKTILEKTMHEIVINKSKFIAILIPISNEGEINTYLNEVRDEYKNATHYCYAYILDQVIRQHDDGEPSGTAGLPILEVLKKEELNHVLAVVIRYFGGIKLGASGLIRAYSKIVKEALKKSNIIELEYGQEFEITFRYDDIKKIEHHLRNTLILSKKYDDEVTYIIWIPSSKKDDNFLDVMPIIKIKHGIYSFQEKNQN